MFGSLLSRETAEEQVTNLALDELLDILSNDRRRRILHILGKFGTISRTDLARELTARETGGKRQGEAYKKRYVSVYQTHLPVLAEHNLVQVSDDGLVQTTAKTEGVLQFLSEVEGLTGDNSCEK